MSVSGVDFGYEQVFELAVRLPPEERERLRQELDGVVPKPEKAEPSGEKEKKLTVVRVETGNPIFTAEDFARFAKNREALLAGIDMEQAEKNRLELIRLAAACPVASAEEVEMQNEVREAMERWKM